MNQSDPPATPATLGIELQRQYARRFDSTLQYRDRVWQTLTEHFFQKFVPTNATLLDVGCGYGQFVNNVRASHKFAMDLNPGTRAHLEPNITFIEQDCSKRWPFRDAELDVVFSSNFLEHLPSKTLIHQTVIEARRCLKPSGKIVLLGPNVRYVPGAYWDFWDHHVALSDRSMVELLELSGFQIDRSIPRFLPYSAATSPAAPVFLMKAYLRLPIVWAIFGRQFLVVGKPQTP